MRKEGDEVCKHNRQREREGGREGKGASVLQHHF